MASLQPGDRVVDLVALSRTTGLVVGLAVSALSSWRSYLRVSLGLAVVLIACLGGLFVGHGVGHLLFPSPDQNVFIVKTGPAALPFTLRATLVVGAVLTLLILVAMRIVAPSGQSLSAAVVPVIASLVLCLALAFASALL